MYIQSVSPLDTAAIPPIPLSNSSTQEMEDPMDNNNNIVDDSHPFNTFEMKGKYVEMTPENDLKFTEGKSGSGS